MLFTEVSQSVDTFPRSSIFALTYSIFLQVFSMASLARTKGLITKKYLQNIVYCIPVLQIQNTHQHEGSEIHSTTK